MKKIIAFFCALIALNAKATEILVKVTYPDQEIKIFTVPISAQAKPLPVKSKTWQCQFQATPGKDSTDMGLTGFISCANGNAQVATAFNCLSPYSIEPANAEATKWRYERFQESRMVIFEKNPIKSTLMETSCKFD